MQIIDIKHVSTGETRTDGRYTGRIGSEVEFCSEAPCIGLCMFLSYVKDNQGNPKSGILRTSIVRDVERTEDALIVTTMNSIYYFQNESIGR